MEKKKRKWFEEWFNKDYVKLYMHRSPFEAAQQVDFLEKALELTQKESILDLGCGMGRHSLEFAKRGYSVTGIDLSEFLIEQAKEQHKQFPDLNVSFVQGDMYTHQHLGTFDVVINMFTSFGYFDDDDQNAKLFKVAHDHLHSGGKFFLDYLHPFDVIERLKDEQKIYIDGEEVIISKTIEGDRVIKTIMFSEPRRVYQEKVKLYSRDKIEEMLTSHHFKIIDVWNDYTGAPWKKDGARQLFYCRKHVG